MDLNRGTKGDTMEYIKEYTMPFEFYTYNTDLNALEYPVIFKPVLCQGMGRNVQLIKNTKDAEDYIKNVDDKIIIQKYHEGPYEIGILYERNPFVANGKIVAIVERNYKNRNPQDLWGSALWNNDRQNKYNNMFINRPDLITEALILKIDEITKKIPNLYACRYDIRYSNEDDLKKGKNFYILEVNGTMGGDLRIYDKDCNWYYYFSRWVGSRVFIGFCNLLKFNSVNVLDVITSTPQRLEKTNRCNDYEKIFEWVHT